MFSYVTGYVSGGFSLDHRNGILFYLVSLCLCSIPVFGIPFLQQDKKWKVLPNSLIAYYAHKIKLILAILSNSACEFAYIADSNGIGSGQLDGRCIWHDVDRCLIFVPCFSVFPLWKNYSNQKKVKGFIWHTLKQKQKRQFNSQVYYTNLERFYISN